MQKSLITPIMIIVAAAVVGGMAIYSRDSAQEVPIAGVAQATLRQADLEVNGMFCIGCSGSVEGAVAQMPGVVSVSADSKTDSGVVVYDPAVISVDTILASPIFVTYPARLISDQPYEGSGFVESPEEGLPVALQEKLAEVSLLLQQKRDAGEDIQLYEDTFVQLNKAIEEKRYSGAEIMLDSLLLLRDE